MHIKTKGILLYSKISKDSNLFIKFLSENDEIVSGLVFGGASSKKKNIFQLGYFLNFNLSKKNTSAPNIITAELVAPYLSSIIDDKYKLHCVMAIVSLLNVSIIEGQRIKSIYSLSEDLLNLLIFKKKWLIYFIKYLFNILKIIGYDVDYKANENKNYFDFDSFQFKIHYKNKFIIFPHKMLNNEIKINYKHTKTAFIIFDEIFQNNHLNNMNHKLPINYINFKNLILEYLKIKDDKFN